MSAELISGCFLVETCEHLKINVIRRQINVTVKQQKIACYFI